MDSSVLAVMAAEAAVAAGAAGVVVADVGPTGTISAAIAIAEAVAGSAAPSLVPWTTAIATKTVATTRAISLILAASNGEGVSAFAVADAAVVFSLTSRSR